MSLAVEPHPITRQHHRFNEDTAEQRELVLTYTLDGQQAEVRVTADRNEVVSLGPLSDLLPSPQANDLLVILGEEINGRARGRSWEIDSATARTFSFGLTELLARMGQSKGGKSYKAVLETARRLARLRVTAKGGAWRVGGKRVRGEVVTGFFDRLEIIEREDAPGGVRVAFTLSVDFARQLAEDYRLLETSTYWRIDSDPARRLYRILDLACYAHNHRGEQTLRVPVAFLRDRIPIDASKTHHVIRALDRYHAELVRVGFLAAEPKYESATAEDFRRFPSFPGHRARLVSVVYQIARDSTPERRAAPLNGEEKAKLLTAAGVEVRPESDLAYRMRLVHEVVGPTRHVGLLTAASKALTEDQFHVALSTARQEPGRSGGAATFVREAKALLVRSGQPVPKALQNGRELAKLL
jgi:hypothetical protein